MRDAVKYACIAVVISSTRDLLRRRLTVIWRGRLTKQLHDKYMSAMTYYKVSHLNRGRIKDVEQRITREPNVFAKKMAAEAWELCTAFTGGVYFTYRLITDVIQRTRLLEGKQLLGGRFMAFGPIHSRLPRRFVSIISHKKKSLYHSGKGFL